MPGLHPVLLHFLKDADGIRNPALQRIIGVHQQDAGIRIDVRISLEGGIFIRETHHPAVCMRSCHRHIEQFSAEDVAGRHTATDDGGSCPVGSRIRPLRSAQTEFQHSVSLRRIANSGRLRGNQGLVIDDVQNRGFHQLRFHNRRNHLD